VRVDYRDPEEQKLRYHWEVRKESTDRRSGGDAERPPDAIPDAVKADGDSGATVVTTPDEPGAYRLFVTVLDGHGSGCTENWPFHVDAQP
jgi:hypothetical protein